MIQVGAHVRKIQITNNQFPRCFWRFVSSWIGIIVHQFLDLVQSSDLPATSRGHEHGVLAYVSVNDVPCSISSDILTFLDFWTRSYFALLSSLFFFTVCYKQLYSKWNLCSSVREVFFSSLRGWRAWGVQCIKNDFFFSKINRRRVFFLVCNGSRIPKMYLFLSATTRSETYSNR